MIDHDLHDDLERLDAADHVDRDAFHVDDDRKAEWAARKLAKVERKRADVVALAEHEIARVTGWRDGELERLDRDAAWFRDLLTGYLRQLRRDDPKVKTYRLPSATIRARQTPAKVEYDPAALAAWADAEGRDELLRVKVDVDRTAVKVAVLTDGEVIPGVTIIPPQDTYSVALSDENGPTDE
jgi:phage host-nuclease inhibitor protein Gam